MNISLWILQVLIAFHTFTGAIWKFFQSAEQTMPSLKALRHEVWLGMSVLELIVSVCLILPALYQPAARFVPIAAGFLIAEMLLFCVLHLRSGDANFGPMIYWLVVAALCGLLAYGRFKQTSP
jgi:hypothetical protein